MGLVLIGSGRMRTTTSNHGSRAPTSENSALRAKSAATASLAIIGPNVPISSTIQGFPADIGIKPAFGRRMQNGTDRINRILIAVRRKIRIGMRGQQVGQLTLILHRPMLRHGPVSSCACRKRPGAPHLQRGWHW